VYGGRDWSYLTMIDTAFVEPCPNLSPYTATR